MVTVTASDPEAEVEVVHEAEQLVALVEDQVNVVVLVSKTDVGLAERFTVGAGVAFCSQKWNPPHTFPPPHRSHFGV